jgi:hypothetical protein
MKLFTGGLPESPIGFLQFIGNLIKNQQASYPLDVIEHIKKICTAMVTGLFSAARRVSLEAVRYPSTG